MKYVGIIIIALLSVVISEIIITQVIFGIDSGLDITGNYFVTAVAPAVLITMVVAFLVLGRWFRQRATYIAIFAAVFLGAYGTLLTRLGNPTSDVVSYLVTAAVVLGIVLLIVRTIWWRNGVDANSTNNSDDANP